MKACDEKLRSSLVEAMKLDNARLEEELQHCEPHVFSDDFERRMKKLMKVQRSKGRIRTCFRYIAAAVLVLFLTGGILFIGSEDLRASELSINILEWLDEFFTVENGVDDRSDDGVLFDESRIGYMPEGFEKAEELVTFSYVQYEFRNDNDESVIVNVYRDITSVQIDNEDIDREVHLNEDGYEYTQTYKSESSDNSVMWVDNDGIYYCVAGTIECSELIKIMNGISY